MRQDSVRNLFRVLQLLHVPEKLVPNSSPSSVPAAASGKKSPNTPACISAAASESAHDYMKYKYGSKDPHVFEKA